MHGQMRLTAAVYMAKIVDVVVCRLYVFQEWSYGNREIILCPLG